MIIRKEVLEDIGGYDDEMAYGEDFDIPERIDKAGYRREWVKGEEYHKLVSSLSEVYRQGRWYGKSILWMVYKHPSSFPSLLSIGLFSTLPFITLGAVLFSPLTYLAALQYLLIGFYVILGFYRTRNPYIVAVPLIKVVRSIAEVVGIVEGFFTTDFGRE
ncbi:MAG: hypothetical protein BRC29_00790 [Nanohaloarchaea archaeon SW_7_43_1]|nr:MAG: hypothetical protein BRC29_00790 [Nanohaloarchaea archaeon SW_7_43_1]